ncbi:MAG: DUF4494 domain-containing protein [Bacteroidaceae bacterium]|nr:DUF4494 domain-containing protein [Bacteroidaceae bacterium]
MYGKWFECKVSLKRTLEDGLQKQVKEVYIVDAVNFTEAEARILDETKVYGDVTLISIKYCEANEIVDSHNPLDGLWYKVKVAMISIDESAGKEKKVNVIYYVRAKDFKSAFENTEKWLGGSVMDSTIISIAETNIMEVFEYKKMPE